MRKQPRGNGEGKSGRKSKISVDNGEQYYPQSSYNEAVAMS